MKPIRMIEKWKNKNQIKSFKKSMRSFNFNIKRVI